MREVLVFIFHPHYTTLKLPQKCDSHRSCNNLIFMQISATKAKPKRRSIYTKKSPFFFQSSILDFCVSFNLNKADISCDLKQILNRFCTLTFELSIFIIRKDKGLVFVVARPRLFLIDSIFSDSKLNRGRRGVARIRFLKATN